jgi:hypothetical protein
MMRTHMNHSSPFQRAFCDWAFVFVVAALMLSGCGQTLRTKYGQSRGVDGDESINGFGVLRRAYVNEGWQTRDVNRLNQRLENVETLVWLPDTRDSLDQDAIDWLEEWLQAKKRTLIYLVPDNGCEADYLHAARVFAPPEQKLEYRRRLARVETMQSVNRLRETSILANDWFGLEYLPDQRRLTTTSGPWQFVENDLSTAPRTLGPSGFVSMLYRIRDNAPTIIVPTASVPSAGTVDTEQALTHTPLMTLNDGSVIISRLSREDWKESQIIVVSNGSLLSNYSLTTPSGRALASHLINQSGDNPATVAFLHTDYRGAQISEVDPEINALTGMELFTVWPLSLIMLHLAVMGLVACMILLPIFGRPREGESKSASDFGDHLDAVAKLMHHSGGEDFARRRVSEYMKRIRGEVTGEWVIPDPKPPSTPSTPSTPATRDDT